MIGWGLVTFLVTTLGLLFVHPRNSPEKATKLTRHGFDFLRRPQCLICLVATFIQGLTYYGPSVYLPSIGADWILNDSQASIYVPLIFSTLGGGLGSLLIWPFAPNLWSRVLYSLAFGAAAGGFAVFRPRFAAAAVDDDTSVTSATSSENDDKEKEIRQKNKSMFIFGVFAAACGIAIITSGFMAKTLDHRDPDWSEYILEIKWRSLMIYTGIAMAVASLGGLARQDMKIGAKPKTS